MNMTTTLVRRTLLSIGSLLENAQCQTATTDLAVVTLARELACALINLVRPNKLVATEALSTIFGTGDTEATVCAVVNTLGGGDLLVADICKLETSKDTSSDTITEATLVSVARDRFRYVGSSRCKGESGVYNGGLRDV